MDLRKGSPPLYHLRTYISYGKKKVFEKNLEDTIAVAKTSDS